MQKDITQKKKVKKILKGVVVSDKMKDTVVVSVERYIKHPKYKKYYKVSKRYKAHDPENLHKEGETVTIEATRPISKDKHFTIVKNV